MDPLLSVTNLTVQVVDTGKRIVDDVSFDLKPKEILAIVGGSGSGKTTTAFSIVNLLSPGLRAAKGEIHFKGQNLRTLSADKLREVRGGQIGVIFQEPLDAFNPVFTVGAQIEEVLVLHTDLNRPLRRARVLELFKKVGLTDPDRVYSSYPHQLSGGMRQRAMIAQALAAEPDVLIADEPTSNLDVTLQARILELFRTLRDELNIAIVIITHDLGVVEHLADRVVVMTQGRAVETGATSDVIGHPRHDYTKALMATLKV